MNHALGTTQMHMAQRATPGHRPQHQPVTSAPPGTFAPGTKVQVGSRRVVIEKYLSEGGFAHVYVVRVPAKDGQYEVAVLKRVAVPDKEQLASMRTEVETMKKLQGHRYIVRYIDSHASQLKGGGYEVFLLMEYCAGGGLIDFMNTRLQYRLTEPEILKIFSDVAEGVAAMHYLKPPLLHRDLKVENVLISAPPATDPKASYKLCDFGSTAPPRPAATDAAEARLIEDDIQRHTTMQYRSPEMIDVWRKLPIDEKSDIWALGVLLYKLCYYTTPFEEVGQMAILNAKFKFPHHPFFSERLRKLISAMLNEAPSQRPNIFQVVSEVCNMRGTPVPVKNIYADRTRSEDARNQKLPPNSQVASTPPAVGISHAPKEREQDVIPDITPMRRGRPTAPVMQQHVTSEPSRSPVKGDPFAALDSKNQAVRASAVDELSNKFPSLDEFSIALDQRSDVFFSKSESTTTFSRDETAKVSIRPAIDSVRPSEAGMKDRANASAPAPGTAKDISSSDNPALAAKPLPLQPPTLRPNYVSTGTMTNLPSPGTRKVPTPTFNPKPIWRVPDHHRSESLPRPSSTTGEQSRVTAATARSLQPSPRPEYQRGKLSPAQNSLVDVEQAVVDSAGHALSRASSLNKRSRPVSAAFVGSNLDYLRDHESNVSKSPPASGSRRPSRQQLSAVTSPEDSKPIRGDTDYLRSLEASEEKWQKDDISNMSVRSKRATMQLAPGKITSPSAEHDRQISRSSSVKSQRDLASDRDLNRGNRPLSPVAASEATSGSPRPPLIDIGGLEELEDLPQEMRREMERQLASAEERRVAEAAVAYKKSPGAMPAVKSNTIQQRMQSLLDEGRSSPVARTAAGYGRYTDEQTRDPAPVPRRALPSNAKVISPTGPSQLQHGLVGSPKVDDDHTRYAQPRDGLPAITGHANMPQSALPGINRTGPKPAARPKPVALRTGQAGEPAQDATQSPAKEKASEWQSAASNKSQGSRLAALLAKDQEGVAEAGPGGKSLLDEGRLIDTDEGDAAPAPLQSAVDKRDWELEFSKRYPSLSGIELVNTDASGGGVSGSDKGRGAVRIRDV